MSKSNLKIIIFAGLIFCILILWQEYQVFSREYYQPTNTNTNNADINFATPNNSNPNNDNPAPLTTNPENVPLPKLEITAQDGIDTSATSATNSSNGISAAPIAKIITVNSKYYTAKITSQGGDIFDIALTRHPIAQEFPDRPYHLLEKTIDRNFYANSGLSAKKIVLPNHHHIYTLIAAQTQQSEYTIDQTPLQLTMETTLAMITLQKIYTFRPDSYLIDIDHKLIGYNQDEQILSYFQLVNDGGTPPAESPLLPAGFGVAFYTENSKFQKYSFDDISDEELVSASSDGWIGFYQRYFLAAWINNTDNREFFARKSSDQNIRIGMLIPMNKSQDGNYHSNAKLYAGALEQEQLNQLDESKVAPGVNLAVDYGWLTFIAAWLFKLLSWLYSICGNWGLAIILLTLLIKLLFYPLSAKSYRSMANLKKVSPKINRLKEKYGEDKAGMQQALMKLYREEKINPFGGCLPILVQIPVFIALYWVLLGSVELRLAPFGLWIQDLSSPDPYFILPIAMGAAMFLQTKLSPASQDANIATVMKIMPIFFAGLSLFFPSGLVLYWLINTLLSISQQWYITRSIERASK